MQLPAPLSSALYLSCTFSFAEILPLAITVPTLVLFDDTDDERMKSTDKIILYKFRWSNCKIGTPDGKSAVV